MAELTLQELLDSGISLEEILFNKEPVQVNVTVDTSSLEEAIQVDRNNTLGTLRNIQDLLVSNNAANKELLIKALSLIIKQSKLPVVKEVSLQREVTGLHMVRNKHTNLLENIELIRK